MAKTVERSSRLTCPSCGYEDTMDMPTNACLFFHHCKSCAVRLKPLAGDCCVFCSYGSVPCPPVQVSGAKERRDKNCCQ